MNDMNTWQNAQLPIFVEQGDATSVSASIILELIDSSISLTITKTAAFVDIDGTMTADLSLDAADTAVVGVYSYQILENFASEDPLIYPNPDACEDEECELPTLTICESLDQGDIS